MVECKMLHRYTDRYRGRRKQTILVGNLGTARAMLWYFIQIRIGLELELFTHMFPNGITCSSDIDGGGMMMVKVKAETSKHLIAQKY